MMLDRASRSPAGASKAGLESGSSCPELELFAAFPYEA